MGWQATSGVAQNSVNCMSQKTLQLRHPGDLQKPQAPTEASGSAHAEFRLQGNVTGQRVTQRLPILKRRAVT